MKNVMLSILGFAMLTIGAIGLLLPICPTTPFVLAAVACFSANPKLRKNIMRIGFFREYIENYCQRKGLTRKTVLTSLIFLWSMLLISGLIIQTWWIVLVLGLVGVAVTIHITCIARPKNMD